MILQIATACLLALAAGAHTDTTVSVRSDARLELNDYGGSIAVSTWNRNAVRIEADHGSRTVVRVETSPVSVVVRALQRLRLAQLAGPEGSRVEEIGIPSVVEYRLTVPRGMALRLSGVNTEMNIEGVEGEVVAQTVKGPVVLSGGRGLVRLSSIEGGVQVRKARGRLEVSSVNEGVELSDIQGEIKVESVNGDVDLSRVSSDAVEAETVNGDISYDGTIRDGGRYRLATHEGDVTVYVPPHANATVAVGTYNGDFDSSFPVQLHGLRRGKRFEFTLGDGRAELDLSSFSGDVRLLRPGETAGPDSRGHEKRAVRRFERRSGKRIETRMEVHQELP